MCKRLNFTASSSQPKSKCSFPLPPTCHRPSSRHEPPNMPLPCCLATLPRLVVVVVACLTCCCCFCIAATSAPFDALCIALLPCSACPCPSQSMPSSLPPFVPACLHSHRLAWCLSALHLVPHASLCLAPFQLSSLNRETQFRHGVSNVEIPMHMAKLLCARLSRHPDIIVASPNAIPSLPFQCIT